MEQQARVKNVKRNLIFNVLKFIAQLILQFALRTALIYKMGVDYVGLNGLFTNVFSFLNLAELGIGSAIVFSMYKPIAQGDIEKVKTLIAYYKKFYTIIACVIAVLGLIIMPFIRHLINGEVTVNVNLYILYAMYLVNTVIGYFSAHKRSLLYAYQRNDIESKVKTICMFLMTAIQIAVVFIFKNYYVYFAITLVFTFVENLLIHVWASKLFPELLGKSQPLDTLTRKEITKNATALSMHKIGSVVVFSTDNIIISSLLGLTVLGVYSNYYLIITSLTSVFLLLSSALPGSIGNLIASTSKEYVYERFERVNFIFTLLTVFSTVCLLVLFQPFIKIWTPGEEMLLNYSTVILICISFFVTKMRMGVLAFIDGAGLFYQNRFIPLIEAGVNIVVSIVLGLHMGLDGVIIGTIVSSLVAPVWSAPHVLYKYYFKKSVWLYFKQYFMDVLITIAVAFLCHAVCSYIPDGTIGNLILKFAVCIVVAILLIAIVYAPTRTFKETYIWGKNMISRRKLDK
ncbi:MAG: hypothetical protein IJZ73_00580 [Clostridia bacterium]|nr:hypothetical protein [Clostridia bacterium]